MFRQLSLSPVIDLLNYLNNWIFLVLYNSSSKVKIRPIQNFNENLPLCYQYFLINGHIAFFSVFKSLNFNDCTSLIRSQKWNWNHWIQVSTYASQQKNQMENSWNPKKVLLKKLFLRIIQNMCLIVRYLCCVYTHEF